MAESNLIDPHDINNNEFKNIKFNEETGYYTFKNSVSGEVNDVVTTEEDMANGIYKYTCADSTDNGSCIYLFLFTERPYLISDNYSFKQGYTYSFELTDTTSRNAGLYKDEDDYTINNSNYTYYYRGDVNNNWVKFGNSLWRVVRINGNGTIRMIYSGLANDNNHMGYSAQIKTTPYGDVQTYTVKTPDITGLTSDLITTKYSNGRFSHTNVGYMYNPNKVITTYPDKEVNSVNSLNNFMSFSYTSSTTPYYFFKNFDQDVDCFTGDGTSDNGACILKCRKLGNDGDCVYANWNVLSTEEGNYSTTAPGVYPETNPTKYVYTSDYKYTCWRYGTPLEKENSDGTTSVYVTCPVVSEIVGTIKDNPGYAITKYRGLFPVDVATSKMNIKDSGIKKEVDTWYENNILDKKDSNNNYLEDYLADAVFCNDRSSDSMDFTISYSYSPYYRNYRSSNPDFKCYDINNDGFTLKTSGTKSRVEASGIGNKQLKYPVALITADEIVFAGGRTSATNNNYYLYTGTHYWTMSPNSFSAYGLSASLAYINTEGTLVSNDADRQLGVRPVINLKSDILYKSGNGTESNPYIIEPNS